MVSKFIIFICSCVLAIFSCQGVFAEMIYLRDGRVVNEKIIERTDDYIITRTGNFLNKYYSGQVLRIIEEEEKEGILQAEPGELTEQKKKLIRDFIEVSAVRENMEKNIEQVINSAQEDKQQDLRELFNIEEIIERLIPVYGRYYSESDLQDIILFYKSPAGKKLLQSTSDIVKESVEVSMQYFIEKASQ